MSDTDVMSDVEMRAWQRRIGRVLSDLLDEADACNLPLLCWTVGRSGTLIGDCFQPTAEERNAAFSGWSFLVGGTVTATPIATGGMRLETARKGWGSGRLADVVIRAEIVQDNDSEHAGGEPQ